MEDDEKKYTITLSKDDFDTIDYPDSITIDLGNYTDDYVTQPVYSSPVGDTSVTDTFTFYTDDSWPAQYKIEQMIQHYPALKIQYEKFLEVYNLVKDDWKDDEIPF